MKRFLVLFIFLFAYALASGSNEEYGKPEKYPSHTIARPLPPPKPASDSGEEYGKPGKYPSHTIPRPLPPPKPASGSGEEYGKPEKYPSHTIPRPLPPPKPENHGTLLPCQDCSATNNAVCGYDGKCVQWFANTCFLTQHNCLKGKAFSKCKIDLCNKCCPVF